jgi:hypothetical protein
MIHLHLLLTFPLHLRGTYHLLVLLLIHPLVLVGIVLINILIVLNIIILPLLRLSLLISFHWIDFLLTVSILPSLFFTTTSLFLHLPTFPSLTILLMTLPPTVIFCTMLL